MQNGGSVTRRQAVRAVGGALAVPTLVSSSPSVGADDRGVVRVTVGYAGHRGEEVVRSRAQEVIYEFAFDALTVLVDEAAEAALGSHDGVRYVERDRTYHTMAQTVPWGVDRVDADLANDEGRTGDGVDVAIIDTGIDRFHNDLAGNLGRGAGFTGGQQHDQWQDDDGHGTHVAGIAGAIDNDIGVIGVSPAITLHAVKVMTSPGAGLSSDVAKGIEWVAEQGYEVANMSLGGDPLESVSEACEFAAQKGVTLVASAGNDGPCQDCVTYPAAYPQVIAVAATTQGDDQADFSSQGPEVDIAAPGTAIRSTLPLGYGTRSGTSMASPHVAGAAALLAAAGKSREEIRSTLRETAEDVGLSASAGGAGLLDVAGALGIADGVSSPTPDPPSTDSPANDGSPTGTAGSPTTDASTGSTGTPTADGGSASGTPAASSPQQTDAGSTRAGTGTEAGTDDPVGSLYRIILDAIVTIVRSVVDAVTGLVP